MEGGSWPVPPLALRKVSLLQFSLSSRASGSRDEEIKALRRFGSPSTQSQCTYYHLT